MDYIGQPITNAIRAKSAEPRLDEDRRTTPIDEAVGRLADVACTLSEMTRDLERNADRIFGPAPEPKCSDALAGMVAPGEPSLIDRLMSSIQNLESERNRLGAAVSRNCWAV